MKAGETLGRRQPVKRVLVLIKRQRLQKPVNVSGFHVILGLVVLPDGVLDMPVIFPAR